MRVPPKERGQVLIILAASWLLFGGGEFVEALA